MQAYTPQSKADSRLSFVGSKIPIYTHYVGSYLLLTLYYHITKKIAIVIFGKFIKLIRIDIQNSTEKVELLEKHKIDKFINL